MSVLSNVLTRLMRARPGADPDATSELLGRLLREHARLHSRRYLAAFGFMAIGAAATAAMAYLIGTAVNEVYLSRNYAGIVAVAIAAVVIFVAKGAASYGQAVTLARISNAIVAANQKKMFDKLVAQNLIFYADKHSADFVARVNYGASAASQVLNLLVTALGRDVLTLIGLVAVMVWQAPVLSIVGVLVMPPAVIGLRKLMKRVRSVTKMQFDGTVQVLRTLQETVQGLKVIKAFNLEDLVRGRVYANVDEIERAANKVARVSARGTPLMETLGGLAIAGVMLVGGYGILVLDAAPGGFVSFITAFLLAYEPAKRIARLNLDLQQSLVGVRVLFDLLDLPDEPDDVGTGELVVTNGEVAFRDVGFAYRRGEPVLQDVSFTAAAHETTAFVGASGGGKSTIFSLLLGLYRPSSGAITIDGTDIATVSARSLRSAIAYVGQDVFLFHGTIRENIALGRPGASEAEIVEAARAAFAHDFIMGFPQGYDTAVGEHGTQLSGGQRQRLSIARALLRDAPIVLLDEPTAALDSEAEAHVQAAIAELTRARTTLVIAHRLYTIVGADRIVVVDAGRIVEQGRHEELLRRGQRYAAFYQLRLSEPADDAPRAAEPPRATVGAS